MLIDIIYKTHEKSLFTQPLFSAVSVFFLPSWSPNMQMVISFLFQEHSAAPTGPPRSAAGLSWRYRRESHSAPGKNGSAGRPRVAGWGGSPAWTKTLSCDAPRLDSSSSPRVPNQPVFLLYLRGLPYGVCRPPSDSQWVEAGRQELIPSRLDQSPNRTVDFCRYCPCVLQSY